MNRGRWAVVAVAVAAGAAIAAGTWASWPVRERRAARPGARATLAVSAALGAGDVAGFARALAPRPLSFPDDHGPHPEFRTEWWYYTGNLRDRATAVTSASSSRSSAPRSRRPARVGPRGLGLGGDAVYLAHFA